MDWKFTDNLPTVPTGKLTWLAVAFSLLAFALICLAAF
jgi:hypothetical protein